MDLVVLVLVLNFGSALSQAARSGRPLPQWLTGIIAVVGFLFLTFVVLLIKRAWCEKPKRTKVDQEAQENQYETVMGDRNQSQRRSSTELPTYTNLAMDKFEDKVTAM